MVMHRGFSLLMVSLIGVVVAPFPEVPASASCAGPSLEGAGRLVLHRGGSTSVEGRSFVDGCRDTMTCSGVMGCQKCTYDEPPERPQEDIRLELRQRGHTWLLATADAGSAEDQRLGWVTWTFELPDEVRPGPAKLLPEGAQPAGVRVR